MLLEGRTVAVFAATGAIGSAVARRMSVEGARLFVSGRHRGPLAALAEELRAPFEVVDAMDQRAVERHLERVVAANGALDATFNAIGPRPDELGYGLPAVDLDLDALLQTVAIVTGSQFLVARAAARHMVRKGRGAIVTLSASLSGRAAPFMAGLTAACAATEGLTRSLAAEMGPHGVRVNCVRAGGMLETRTMRETFAAIARTTGGSPDPPPVTNLLGRSVTPEETAQMVAVLASDMSSGMTGQVVDVSAGAVVAS